jgi:hypothetical protein
MIPDLRFIIGAATATALLGFTLFGLVAAAHLAHQSKVGPLEASRLLAYSVDIGHPVAVPTPPTPDPFATIAIEPNVVPLRLPPPSEVSPSLQAAINAEPIVEPASLSAQTRIDADPAVEGAPTPAETAVSASPPNEPAQAAAPANLIDELDAPVTEAATSSSPTAEPASALHAAIHAKPDEEPAAPSVQSPVGADPVDAPALPPAEAAIPSDRGDELDTPAVHATVSPHPVEEPASPAVQSLANSNPAEEPTAPEPQTAASIPVDERAATESPAATPAVEPPSATPEMKQTASIPAGSNSTEPEHSPPPAAEASESAAPRVRRTPRKARRQAYRAPTPIDPFARSGYPLVTTPRTSVVDRPPRGFQFTE